MPTTTPHRMRIGGVELHVEAPVGAGDPLVLVHGGWTDHTAFDAVVESLARSFRVIRYDRRGHSRSQYGPAAAPRRRDEDDLAELIEALGLGPAHLVGTSYGAAISLALAIRRPELVRSVLAHEPPAARPRPRPGRGGAARERPGPARGRRHRRRHAAVLRGGRARARRVGTASRAPPARGHRQCPDVHRPPRRPGLGDTRRPGALAGPAADPVHGGRDEPRLAATDPGRRRRAGRHPNAHDQRRRPLAPPHRTPTRSSPSSRTPRAHVRDHGEDAAVLVLAGRQAELVEDRAHVLLHGQIRYKEPQFGKMALVAAAIQRWPNCRTFCL